MNEGKFQIQIDANYSTFPGKLPELQIDKVVTPSLTGDGCRSIVKYSTFSSQIVTSYKDI